MRQKIVWSLLLIFIFQTSKAQMMKSTEIFKEKAMYFELADSLAEMYSKEYKGLKQSLSFEYTFTEIKLSNAADQEEILSARISPEYNIYEVWTKEQAMNHRLESFIRHFLSDHPSLVIEKSQYKTNHLLWQQSQSVQVGQYLQMADLIAEAGSYCTSGDNYSPGYYSKISISPTGILLAQVNYWNAYSLDRENYCMRKLYFYIPFQKLSEAVIQEFKKETDAFSEIEQKGDMLIYFQDHSSKTYRSCGEKIAFLINELLSK